MAGRSARTSALALLVGAALTLAACETRQQTGALVGSAAGATIGAIVGHNTELGGWEGAAIGAALGGLTGYVVADVTEPKRVEDRSATMERTGGAAAGSDAAAERAAELSFERVRVNRELVANGETLAVTSQVAVVHPDPNREVSYSVSFRFQPEGGEPLGIRKMPMQKHMTQGTWRHHVELTVQNLDPGPYKLHVLLLDEDHKVRDRETVSVTVQ